MQLRLALHVAHATAAGLALVNGQSLRSRKTGDDLSYTNLAEVRLSGRAAGRAEIAEGFEDGGAVEFGFAFAYAGDFQEVFDRRGVAAADFVESSVVQDYEGGDALGFGCFQAPLAQVGAQFRIDIRRSILFCAFTGVSARRRCGASLLRTRLGW
jgi:hypothetical protein